jgi:hypothetical protein
MKERMTRYLTALPNYETFLTRCVSSRNVNSAREYEELTKAGKNKQRGGR